MFNIRFVLVIGAAIVGCTGGTPVTPAPGVAVEQSAAGSTRAIKSEIIALRYDVTVDYGDLSLRWLTLADSRCPIGVTCVWGGHMLATVEVTHATQGAAEIELLRRAGREPEVAHAFGWEFRLQNVSPHPKDGVKPDRANYVMRVEIRKP